ncbi:MAG: hypothetical protein ACJ8AW_45185 [Rhodopila sp.]
MQDNTITVQPDPAGRCLTFAPRYREIGDRYLTLAADEVLAAVVLPPPDGWRSGYAKGRIRDAIDFPLASVAMALRRDGNVIGGLRVAITGTNSAPLPIPADELIGRAPDDAAAAILAQAVRRKANVLRTTVVGASYRRRLVQALGRRLMETLWNNDHEWGTQ